MGIVGAVAELERSGLMIPIMVIGGKNMALLADFSVLEILVGRFGLAWADRARAAVMKVICKVLYRPLAMVYGRICAVGRM